jgi:hypothetical protein
MYRAILLYKNTIQLSQINLCLDFRRSLWESDIRGSDSKRILLRGGPRRDRTDDPRIKSPLLYRLS